MPTSLSCRPKEDREETQKTVMMILSGGKNPRYINIACKLELRPFKHVHRAGVGEERHKNFKSVLGSGIVNVDVFLFFISLIFHPGSIQLLQC